MAMIGLSYPMFAAYTNTSGTVTYSDGRLIGEAVNFDLTVDAGDGNPLYGDNGMVDNDAGTFSSGNITLEVTSLTPANKAWLLGAKTVSRTVGSDTVSELVYDEDLAPIYCGFGIIIKDRTSGTVTYKALVFPKVQCNLPELSVATQGEEIDWQLHELEFTVMRSDEASTDYNGQWVIESPLFTTEALAQTYINTVLNYSE